jgi:hypothetical protein
MNMAKKSSGPRNQVKRNRATLRAAGRVDPEILRELIEAERCRLMRAEAVLHCVLVALDDDDSGRADVPHYQSAIDVARDLIKQSINGLDSVQLPLIERETRADATVDTTRNEDRVSECANEVKEHALRYVH